MSQENQLTPEEVAELQRYNDSTQKAHEGLTEDNNKRIRLVLTKRLFICAGIPILFFTGILGVLLGASLNNLQHEKDKSALTVENEGLNVKINAMKRGLDNKNAMITSLYQAAEIEKQKNAAYYEHMKERAEGLTDHILNLNNQLEEKDDQIIAEKKLTNRYKIRNDTKKKFIEMAFAIAANNPPRFREAVGDESLPQMRFYPLVVKMAIGLGSLDILNHIQTVDKWDTTIPKGLADHVKNPESVPLKRYEQLLFKGKKMQTMSNTKEQEMNQLKGRIADQERSLAANKALIEELKGKVYDEKYLPYSTQQVMYISAYHTVAENFRPKDLTKWVGKATPEEWVVYLQMAVARNSYNVYEAIMELKEVTSLPAVQKLIKSSDVLAAIYDENLQN